MAMSNALVTSAAVWELSIDQPTTQRVPRIQHHRAVHLALVGGVLADGTQELLDFKSAETGGEVPVT
jgi:hypothetical protein